MNSSTTFDLTPYSLHRPEKVRWIFEHTDQDPLQNCKSKSLRKILRKYETIIQENNLRVEMGELTKEAYLEWLPYYRQRMQEQGYDLFADEAWYDARVEEGFKIEKIFIYKDDDLVGTAILTRNDHSIFFNFKASKRINRFMGKASLGNLIDFLFVQHGLENNIEIISGGRSRNQTGVNNIVSYLEYKLRFGYTPTAATEAGESQTVELNQEGWVLFYAYTKSWEEDVKLYFVHQKDTQPADTSFLESLEIPLEHIEY